MEFSYFMPSIFEGRFATIGTVNWESMLERAKAVEELGYDGIWVGEFVDFEVAETVISLSAPVEEHVLRYVRRFSPGDAVMLIWAPSDDDTVHTAIRSVQHRDQLSIRRGYILPVEFVDADWIQQRITFKTKVLPDSIIAPASLHPGHRIEVTSPLEQAGETAAILSVEGASGAP